MAKFEPIILNVSQIELKPEAISWAKNVLNIDLEKYDGDLSKLYDKSSCEIEIEYKYNKASDNLYIEGYASTEDIDAENDLILASAWEQDVGLYMKNPVVFGMHNWWDWAIGKAEIVKIDKKGLWVRDYISRTAGDVRELIREGILKTLSVGFNIIDSKTETREGEDIRIITRARLLEHSVVNIPMNAEAMFEQAKSKGIKIKTFYINKELNMDESKEKEIKNLQDKINDLSTTVKSSIETVEDAQKNLAEIEKAVKNCVTTAEFNELKDKAEKDLVESFQRLEKEFETKWSKPPTHQHPADDNIGHVKDLHKPDIFKQHVIETDAEKSADRTGLSKGLIADVQRASDDLLFVGALLGYTKADNNIGHNVWLRPPNDLKAYKEYQRLLQIATKAIDTTDTSNWVPTGYSAELMAGLDLERRVAARISRFPQPTANYDYPLLTGGATAYLVTESTADYTGSQQNITASDLTDSKITFGSTTIGAGQWISYEAVEDMILPVLNAIKQEQIKELARAEESALINGDDATTNMDGVTGSDIRRAWDGFRYDAHVTTGAEYDVQSGSTSFTYSDLIQVMKQAGKYAIDVRNGFFIVSVEAYFQMLAFCEFTGYNVFSSMAVAGTGILPKCLGHDILVSDQLPQNLNASGVYDATTTDNTAILFVNEVGWKIGDRRKYTLETTTNVWSQQKSLVSTMRLYLKKMVPSSDTPTAYGYNIDNT